MKHTPQPRSRLSRPSHDHSLVRCPRPALILALGLLTVSLSGCIDADARGPPANHPVHPGPICTDRCAVPVEDGETRSHESSVARNPQDPKNILVGASAWAGLPGGVCLPDVCSGGPVQLMRHVSFDGGETWDSAPLLGDVPPPALAGSLMMADPFVLFLSDGTALYSGMTSSFAESFDVFVARSPDGGLTWPEATIVAEEIGFWLPPGAGITVDQPFLAVGPGDVVLATWMYKYEGQGLADVGTAVSHDLGRTWSEPVLLTETTGNHGNARPVITDDGTMYITFQDRAIWDATPVWMARSDDNGTTWATWLVEGLAAADYMDLETFGNTLFTPYAEEDAERREHQFLLRSEDGGHTWTKQILTISPRPSHVGPALDVGPDGTAFVLHYVTGTDERPRVVASRVGPDGTLTNATVSGDEPLGEHRFEGFASWPIYGDYSGMIADEHGAIATWVGGNADNEDLLASFLELPSWKGGDRPPGLDEEPNRG